MHQLTIGNLLADALRRDPAGPLLTYYDDATGERSELSATTLANWVAKTANFLTDGLGFDDPSDIAVVLPPHWQTAGILLGTWTAGHRVVDYPDVESGAPPDAVFCTEADLVVYSDARCDVVGVSLDPLGRGLSRAWRRVTDYGREIGGYGDQFRRVSPVPPDAPALAAGRLELSQHSLDSAAHEVATRLGMHTGGRIMVSRDLAAAAGPVSWLLAPLAAACSVVLVTDANSDRLPPRAESEKVTATLGIELAGIPALGGEAR